MWSTALKLLGGSLLTCALIWGLVLGWWQANDHEPSRIDLALYLGALPLAVIGGFLLLRTYIDYLKHPPVPVAPAAGTLRDADPLAQALARNDAAERLFSLHLVDAIVRSAAGRSAAEILAAVAEGKRPEPSTSLVDGEGHPVFAAVADDVDVGGFRAGVAEHAQLARLLDDREDVLRALALLDDACAEALQRTADVMAALPAPVPLRILWLTPPEWHDVDPAVLKDWLTAVASAAFEATRPTIEIVPVGSDVAVLQQLDTLILRANRDVAEPELTLLAGAVSAVDPASVAAWEARGTLFTAASQSGQQRPIPGEGAAVLLLAHAQWLDAETLARSVALSRLVAAKRDKAIGSGGRIRGTLITSLLSALLEARATPPDSVKAVVMDADHRAALVTEALEGIGPLMEHLDPIADYRPIGLSCGSVSPMSPLFALACARQEATEKNANVVCLSNCHDQERAAVLLSPHIPGGEPESSGA